jgi:hypothetical protein
LDSGGKPRTRLEYKTETSDGRNLNYSLFNTDDSENEGGLGNVERVVVRPPEH